MVMWDILGPVAWIASAAIFLWMAWDFFVVNSKYDENILISSREGLDELLPTADPSIIKKKK
jgi:hypothetical protein